MGDLIKAGYKKIFVDAWPVLMAGMLVGTMSIICFTWSRPWGVVGGLRLWADWLFYGIGLYGTKPSAVLTNTNSAITLGLVWGAFGAALVAKKFAFRVPPRMEIYKAIVGGILMGFGASWAGGCNVGGFYSAISALSLSGFAMTVGLIAGAYLGLKYLYWEMEHFPSSAGGAKDEGGKAGFDWNKIKPLLGWIVLLGGYAAFQIYKSQGYTIIGGVVLCGMAFGFILNRTNFCFARAFREPFMTGEAEVPKAVIISIMISVVGFAILKWTGFRAEGSYVTATFGLGALVGGLIFGFGMLLAGG
ncbi:MAG: YeeE/YedE thiosulfate transporter family protein [Thermodesulfobacteriota bacterium]|nr:YeeE/YedE thiosulfate transporter family protein [Thermodesulfobacteriota bacterium]